MEDFLPSKYGDGGKQVFVTREQFLAVAREVLKDVDMISDGSFAGVKPCGKGVTNCLFCDSFFSCIYKRYAESLPDGEVETCTYCKDLEERLSEPHT